MRLQPSQPPKCHLDLPGHYNTPHSAQPGCHCLLILQGINLIDAFGESGDAMEDKTSFPRLLFFWCLVA